MIFAACTCTGFYLSSSMKRRIDRLETEKRLTEEMSTVIRYRSLTLREIISQLAESPFYKELGFIGCIEKSDRFIPFARAWEEGIEKDPELSPAERDILRRMGRELGTTDTEGQLAALGAYCRELEELAADEKEKYSTKGRMYRSLGVLFGAMAGILFV